MEYSLKFGRVLDWDDIRRCIDRQPERRDLWLENVLAGLSLYVVAADPIDAIVIRATSDLLGEQDDCVVVVVRVSQPEFDIAPAQILQLDLKLVSERV